MNTLTLSTGVPAGWLTLMRKLPVRAMNATGSTPSSRAMVSRANTTPPKALARTSVAPMAVRLLLGLLLLFVSSESGGGGRVLTASQPEWEVTAAQSGVASTRCGVVTSSATSS